MVADLNLLGVGGGPVLLQQYFQYAFICCPYMLPPCSNRFTVRNIFLLRYSRFRLMCTFNIHTKHLLHEEFVFFSTRATQEAFKDLNLDSISTTPTPPCSGLPIKVFLFILSRDPHIKLKMSRFIVLTFSELGNFKIEAQ